MEVLVHKLGKEPLFHSTNTAFTPECSQKLRRASGQLFLVNSGIAAGRLANFQHWESNSRTACPPIVTWRTRRLIPHKEAVASAPLGFRSVGAAAYAYSVPACWFRSTAVIIRVAVALNAARKSKLASTPAGPSIGVLASAR